MLGTVSRMREESSRGVVSAIAGGLTTAPDTVMEIMEQKIKYAEFFSLPCLSHFGRQKTRCKPMRPCWVFLKRRLLKVK